MLRFNANGCEIGMDGGYPLYLLIDAARTLQRALAGNVRARGLQELQPRKGT